MPSKTKTTYPPWQKAIREAQAAEAEAAQAAADRQAQEDAARGIEDGANLRRALQLLLDTEDIPELLTNEYIVDGFRFSLSTQAEIRLKEVGNQPIVIVLRVLAVMPESYSGDEWDDGLASRIGGTFISELNWHQTRAHLAARLDAMAINRDLVIADIEARKKSGVAKTPAAAPRLSDAEQLAEAVRRVVGLGEF